VTRTRWSEALVLAYPAGWRRQYGPELARLGEDLVEGGSSRLAVALSVARGGVASRFTGNGMPPVSALWAERTKWRLAAALSPMVIASWSLAIWLSDGWQRAQAFDRIGAPAWIANDAWSVEQLTVLAGLIVELLVWSVAFDGLKWGRQCRPRALSVVLVMPLLAVAASVARTTLGGRQSGSHVWSVAGGVGHYVTTTTTVVAHPLAAAILGADATGLRLGSFTLTPLAVLLAVRRAPADPYLIGRAVRAGPGGRSSRSAPSSPSRAGSPGSPSRGRPARPSSRTCQRILATWASLHGGRS
jgi:hypothetical protein